MKKEFLEELKVLANKYKLAVYDECLYCGRRDTQDESGTFMVAFVGVSNDPLTIEK
jgi:hypothetical protein